MDIAALSMAMATSSVRAEASVAMASKVKDIAEQEGASLVKMMNESGAMEQSVSPNIGSSIDVKL